LVALRVDQREAVIGKPHRQEVRHRIVGLGHLGQRLGESDEHLDGDGVEQAGHASEVRVHRHRRGAGLRGQSAGAEGTEPAEGLSPIKGIVSTNHRPKRIGFYATVRSAGY